jgi:hypothetical protein
MSNFSSFKGDKLVGTSNYLEWKANADLFLEINGYMSYIDGSEESPDKSLYYYIKLDKDNNETNEYGDYKSPELGARYADRLNEFNRNNKRALGALKSIISLENNERFKDKETAEDLYDAIIETFGLTSLELIGRYFDKMVDNNYNSFNNMDEYTSNIQSSNIYLQTLGQHIPKAIIAWLILKGLPSSYDSYASRKYEELLNNLKNINLNKLITDLISEEGRLSSNSNLEANKTSYNNKQAYCKHYNKKGHIEDKCFIKYPELKNNYSSSSINKNKNKKHKKSFKKLKNMHKKEQSTKAIMCTLLVDESLGDKKDTLIKDTLVSNKISPLNEHNFKEEEELVEFVKKRALKKSTLQDDINKGLILDSGASEHYTPYKDLLLDYKPVYKKSISIANGLKLPIKGVGNIPVYINKEVFFIRNVNYVPNIKSTLISSKELTNKGWEILFKNDIAILSYNNKVITSAKWHLNAFFLNEIFINYKALEPIVYNIINYKSHFNSKDLVLNLSNNKESTLLDLYHRRFLHINKDFIIKSAKNFTGLIMPSPDNILNNCDNCYYSKFKEIISRKPHNPVNILEFIDCDILGPFKIKGFKEENYIFTITYRASKCVWLYAIKFKSDVYEIIVNYYNSILTQFKVNIKGARLDNAKEFKSIKLNTFCSSNSLLLEYSSIYTQA